MPKRKRSLSTRARLLSLAGGAVLALLAAGVWSLSKANFAVLNPAGSVAHSERNLIYIACLMSLIVVVPTFILLFSFAWRYREGNTKAVYQPERDGSRVLETIWWLIPGALIVALSVLTWHSTHALEPSKALANTSGQPVLKVQVVALQWKWLFLYPEQHIASVNELHMPVGRPVAFDLTADAPMNSFWIPQLGGQVYAMSGMTTMLNLKADKTGTYAGRSANLSGKGFSGMTFNTYATSEGDFDGWLAKAGHSAATLDEAAYEHLAQPSENVTPAQFQLPDASLYDNILMKYMTPSNGGMNMEEMQQMSGGHS